MPRITPSGRPFYSLASNYTITRVYLFFQLLNYVHLTIIVISDKFQLSLNIRTRQPIALTVLRKNMLVLSDNVSTIVLQSDESRLVISPVFVVSKKAISCCIIREKSFDRIRRPIRAIIVENRPPRTPVPIAEIKEGNAITGQGDLPESNETIESMIMLSRNAALSRLINT